jgi:hypothetical protein
MQISNPKDHRPFHTSSRRIAQYLQVMLAIDHFPGIEDMIAQAGQYLKEVMIRIDIPIFLPIILNPYSLLL